MKELHLLHFILILKCPIYLSLGIYGHGAYFFFLLRTQIVYNNLYILFNQLN